MPAASSEHIKALLRHKLLADAGVTAIVGGRIYGAHMRDTELQNATYPMVIMELDGGGASPTSTFQAATLYLYAYHRESAGEALHLYDLCYAALHHQTLRKDGVAAAGYAMENVRPDDGWNEKARAYYAEGLWTVRASYRST